MITWVELNTKSLKSQQLSVESISYDSLDRFFQLSEYSEHTHEYCVSWIDCFAKDDQIGKGVFMRANHSETPNNLNHPQPVRQFPVPGLLGKSFPLVNKLSVLMLNSMYSLKYKGHKTYKQNMFNFFYPLDTLTNWNNLYGAKGFYQFQCVVPFENSQEVKALLGRIKLSKQGSFLSVLKTMGNKSSGGLISFPRPGVTLALDFPNKGARTTRLLRELESIVVQASGAIYPAKDAHMLGSTFRQSYPKWEEFTQYIDPAFSSSFWRRMEQS